MNFSDSNGRCLKYRFPDIVHDGLLHIGNSTIFDNFNPYGGIPTNLFVNLIAVILIFFMFLIFRKNAIHVMLPTLRKAALKVINKEPAGDNDVSDTDDVELIENDAQHTSIAHNLIEGVNVPGAHMGEIAADRDGTKLNSIIQRYPRQISSTSANSTRVLIQSNPRTSTSTNPDQTVSFWAWFKSSVTMPDADILDQCGNDALQYLRFQRHIIFYLIVLMILSLSIVLPLNLTGELAGKFTDFEHTTLGNLEPTSQYLWAHISLAFLFFPLSIIVMRRFSVQVKFTQLSLEISRTLQIKNIPRHLCGSKDKLIQYFEKTFPTCKVMDLRFAYNVTKLEVVNQKLQQAKSAHAYCIAADRVQVENQDVHSPKISLYPKHCSRYSSWICGYFTNKTNGLQFYGEEEQKLQEQFDREKEVAQEDPLGIAFVTFKSYQNSIDIQNAFKTSIFTCGKAQPPNSSVSSGLKPENWKVVYAPAPEDIYWENLGSMRYFLIKYIPINIALFLFLLFLSTPAEIMSLLNKPELTNSTTSTNNTKSSDSLFEVDKTIPAWVANFLPTLMIWGFTALVPHVVSWSDRFLGHWTRSGKNHSIMRKTFFCLIFMVILLPTFGISSIKSLVTVFFSVGKDAFLWECVFVPDSGAFFVNYLITAAMVGCAMELICLPELVWYAIQSCWSRSKAETPYIRNILTANEFHFGEEYARMMLMFCMNMLYSIACPLITPFGLLYFIIKHYVDRHNLLYAYTSSKINKNVHSTAINFVILSTVLLQFFMMMFSFIRNGLWDGVTLQTKFSAIFFVISVVIYSAQLWADTCKKISPIDYVESIYIREDLNENEKNAIYAPILLMNHDEKVQYDAYMKNRDKPTHSENHHETL